MQCGPVSESAVSTKTSSTGTPRASAQIWRTTLFMPCPNALSEVDRGESDGALPARVGVHQRLARVSAEVHPDRVVDRCDSASASLCHRSRRSSVPVIPSPDACLWEVFPARASRSLEHQVGLRPTCGRVARAPRDTRSVQRFPWDRGQLARFNTPVGLRPTCGRDARAPRNPSARVPFLGPRASCPLQHTGGPAAHLRAGRPRSQEPLRSGAFPGTAGILPASTHRWACGPLAGGSPALPGTPPQGAFPGTAGILPASTHRWACGPLAGGSPALPGTPPLGCLPWERGHLARFNTPVGLRPTCGRDARAPRGPANRCGEMHALPGKSAAPLMSRRSEAKPR